MAVSLLGLLILVIASVTWFRDRELVLAHADGVVVTQEEFTEAYGKWLITTGMSDAPRHRVAFIKDMAATRLVVRDARRGGIGQALHYQTRLEHLSRKLLIDLYVYEALLDTVEVTEREVRDAYVRAQTEITARHLYAQTWLEADGLRKRLSAGESFEALAREVFKDPQLQASGGLLPPFTFDEMDPAFEDAAFTLPAGVYSQPVRTAQGYSIIKVEHRFTRPLITESEFVAKQHLFEVYVLQRKRADIRRKFLHALVKEAAIVFDEAVLEALWGLIRNGAASEGPLLWDRVLLRYGQPQVEWTVADFREHARFASDQQRGQVRDVADLKNFASGLVAGAIMLQRAEVFKQRPAYLDRLREALDDYIISYTRRKLNVDIPEDEIYAYYQNAPVTEFRRPAQVHLRWRIFPTEAEARLARQVTDGSTRYFEASQLGSLAKEVFAAKEGARIGPVKTVQGWVVAIVGPQRPPRQKPYEDVRDSILAMLRDQRLRKQRVDLYNSLATRHDLNVNVDLVTNLALDI